MMVMDGTSSSATTLARLYKGKPLALDEIVTGGVRTYSAESAITDSAPAATALATGNKSNSGYVGVLPTIVSSRLKTNKRRGQVTASCQCFRRCQTYWSRYWNCCHS